MTKHGRWLRVAGWTIVAGIGASFGCQTWVGGMTLPSPDYLKDKPDYIEKSSQFPLPRELNSMQQASRNAGVATTPSAPVAPSVNVPPTGAGNAPPPPAGIN